MAELRCESPEQFKAVARCLGFAIEETAKLEAQTEIYDTHRYPDRSSVKTEQPRPPRSFQTPPQPEPPVKLPDFEVPGALEELGIRAPPTSGHLQAPDGAYEILDRNAGNQALARSTLFTENTSRGLFSAALATLRPGHEIDLSRLFEFMVRGKALPRLPRLPSATLALGCQLLLDYRSSMVPFYEDLASLVAQIAQITPADKIETFVFEGDPSAAQRWTADFEPLAWNPDKRPILTATDFGIQGRGGRAEKPAQWMPFIDRCREKGSPLLILIPWPRERWPVGLGSYPELIHWSPYTTAGMIRRKIGLGHNIPQ
ncbi:MAG: hypothetical protein L0Y38_08645 [Methylococcaceae bacterium]|nr:hypothetical protein [Methylococcaceae bacterium]MCI0733873.1 hypothetical protein [Methylococcaceae bacterium]